MEQKLRTRGSHPPERIIKAEHRSIQEAVRRAKKNDKKEISAQETLPFIQMWQDGTCKTKDRQYTRTIEFQDINYQLSQNEDKSAIFDSWCDFLNFFDSSVSLQLTYRKQPAMASVFQDVRQFETILPGAGTLRCGSQVLHFYERQDI